MAKRNRYQVAPWIPRWLGNLLIVGLVVHAAVGMAWLTWSVLWNEQPVASLYNSGAPKAGGAGQVRAPLASMELFGRPPGNQPVAEEVRRNAPETRLRLTLEGVMVAERPENSGAIVTSGGNTTAHYRVGDMLPGNAELVEVEPARILIRRQGALESLTFDEDSDGPALASMESEPITVGSSDDFLDQAQEQLASEGANALLAFGLQPVDDGGSQGYVFDGSNAMLRAVNLREGDVITAINGYQLGDLEQDRQLLETLRSESQLQVEVERDGARFTVTYALPQ
ncbi:type II secretion system protein N [Marinobacter lacisalsi]|uniref:Type II secretion system protein N n=1 Tax=Marinobacter lacisalsi TaxID=475979 RepID=A0ABV8QKX9_9GAMM